MRPDSNLEQISPSIPSKSFRDSEATKVERYSEAYRQETEPKVRPNICGLQPWTFWILVALIFILCAGAIGGGVGGSVAVQSNKYGSGKSNTAPAKSAKATSTTTTSSASNTPIVSAPNPVPTDNSENHASSFKLLGYDPNDPGTGSGYVSCGQDAPCEFRLVSTRLYGWKSGNLQYVDCYDQLTVHAEDVDRSCLSFDAGFSFNRTTQHFFHGSKTSWWICADEKGWYTSSQDDSCEETNLWLDATDAT